MFRPLKAIFKLNIKQCVYMIQCHKMDEISFTPRHICAIYQLLKSDSQHLNNSIFTHNIYYSTVFTSFITTHALF